MEPKLHKCQIKPLVGDLTKELDAKEIEYEKYLGARETWDENLKQCFGMIRMAALCKQYPVVENLECQYESSNSRDY